MNRVEIGGYCDRSWWTYCPKDRRVPDAGGSQYPLQPSVQLDEVEAQEESLAVSESRALRLRPVRTEVEAYQRLDPREAARRQSRRQRPLAFPSRVNNATPSRPSRAGLPSVRKRDPSGDSRPAIDEAHACGAAAARSASTSGKWVQALTMMSISAPPLPEQPVQHRRERLLRQRLAPRSFASASSTSSRSRAGSPAIAREPRGEIVDIGLTHRRAGAQHADRARLAHRGAA